MTETPVLLPSDPSDIARWAEERVRLRMLSNLHRRDVEQRLNDRLTPGRVCNLGFPLLSLNLFSSTVRQLAVQYDAEPTVTNDRLNDDASTAWSQMCAGTHLWAILQKNSEHVIGLNECLLQIEWTERGLRVKSVTPDSIVVETVPGDVNTILVVKAARVYTINGADIPAWAMWDISDPLNPNFRVEDAKGVDITSKVVIDSQPWPYFNEDGSPFLPFVMYRAQYTSEPWNPYSGSEIVHASLDLAILWTAWAKAILDSSWAQRWVIDLMLQGASIANAGGAGATATVEADPSSVLVFQSKGDKTGSAGQFDAPQDLKAQSDSILTYQATVLSNVGIHPADIESTAGPSSGVAISLKRSAQRRLAMRYVPNFRAADIELFSKMALVSNIFSETQYPVDGWVIQYHLPEESIEEFIAALDRDERLVTAGFISKVDLMMRFHPELSRAQARDKLIQVAAENLEFSMQPPAVPADHAEEMADDDAQLGVLIGDAERLIADGDLTSARASLLAARTLIGLNDDTEYDDAG